MLLLVVGIAVVVLSLVVLGALAFSVLGAFRRLGRELQAAEREVAPLLSQLQATAARAAELQAAEQHATRGWTTRATSAARPGDEHPAA